MVTCKLKYVTCSEFVCVPNDIVPNCVSTMLLLDDMLFA